MNRSIVSCTLAVSFALGIGAVVAACDSNNDGDGGTPDAGTDGSLSTQARCTPNAAECVSPTLARVCPADGTGWVGRPCPQGTACDEGTCKPSVNTSCNPGAGACLDRGTSLRCKSDGSGFEQTTCPSGTQCTGAGQCAGACVAGSSTCASTRAVRTCTDGNRLSETLCAAGEACVVTSAIGAGVPTAACKPAQCEPGTNGCSAVCGNRIDPTAAEQNKFVSQCVPTPDGYVWRTSRCAEAQECAPAVASCGGTFTMDPATQVGQAGCASQCVPGTTRCNDDRTGFQSCGPDGRWLSTPTACVPLGGRPTKCMVHGGTGAAVCGDLLCADAPSLTNAGVCASTTTLRKCGLDGTLAATASPCPSGVCESSGTSVDGLLRGACRSECKDGESICAPAGGSTRLVCQSGRFVAETCPASGDGLGCVNSFADDGSRRATCNAECGPGWSECTNGNADRRVCNAEGRWGAAAPCAVGTCQTDPTRLGRSSCVAECIPNQPYCTGGTGSPGGPLPGTAKYGICTAEGRFDAASEVTCAAGTSCRTRKDGTVVTTTAGGGVSACIECIGPDVPGGNEDGLVDTRCNGGGVATCKSDNTYGEPTTCPVGSSCQSAERRGNGPLSDTCQRNSRGFYRAQSYYARRGMTCRGPKSWNRDQDRGAPIQCGVVPDCCSDSCERAATPPHPAYCSN